jgi:Asp-tRNA(Asn)/Glu-tRNA(Gln) amidotransferase A subunit family amidase
MPRYVRTNRALKSISNTFLELSMTGPISRIASAVTDKQVTPTQVVTRALQNIESSNPTLNYMAQHCPESALKDAENNSAIGALAGVPILVKDLENVVGLPTRKGSLALADAPPETLDGTVVARLKAAGAIVVGKTTLPEFAIEGYTANRATGVTHNPWNLELSPGGSSGGSAAAVSAGAVPIATATDGGGSIRIPAAFCGLVGLKPSNGVIGRWPTPDWIDFSTEGPFATTVADLRLLMSVISGATSGDPIGSVGIASIDYLNFKNQTPTKIYAATRTSDFGDLPTELEQVFKDAVSELSSQLKLKVTWIEPGSLFGTADPDLDWFTVATAEHLVSLGRDWVVENFELLHPASQEFFTQGMNADLDEYIEARRRRFDYVRVMDELLAGDAIMLTPTVAEIGWFADGRLSSGSPAGLSPAESYSTALQNITGHPAISLPLPVMSSGLPGAIQITAARYREDLLLDLAQNWERTNPWQRNATGFESFDAFLD